MELQLACGPPMTNYVVYEPLGALVVSHVVEHLCVPMGKQRCQSESWLPPFARWEAGRLEVRNQTLPEVTGRVVRRDIPGVRWVLSCPK